jgi:NIMA (never in mitosis gene a)-related kinase
MKTIDLNKLDREQQTEAANEVKVLSSLKHPYIVRYHESFLENGTLAIVMDYAEGGDLANRIKRQSQKQELFAEGQVIRWFTQVALGLKYLHARQILHRDLKPQNLFLTKQEDLRLGDFGISKAMKKDALKDDSYMGTPYYFSPEICQEKLYSFASDVWAMGCILYEMAALRVPFEAPNIPTLSQKLKRHHAPNLPPVFSAEMNKLCQDILQRDYNHRPSAAELVQRPMMQAEMKKMLAETPNTPPASAPASDQQIGHQQSRRRSNLELKIPQAFEAPTPPASGRLAPFAASEMRRSPSAPSRLVPHGDTILRSASTALIKETGAMKPAWPEKNPKDGMFGHDDTKSLLAGGNLNNHCVRLNSQFSRCGATRGLGRTNRRRPAVPVWQGIH